jgi:hypothetical protein|nr:MAG TPA: Protein of unknown function (DUF1642) [Caudoviricetes sp.]
MTKFEEELMATAKMIPTSDGNEIKFKTSSALYDYLLLSNGEAELYLQQQSLPVVPEFVGEFITKVKKAGNNLTFAFNSKFDECPAKYWNEAIVWRLNHPEEFALAFITGKYEVERPQLFRLKLKNATISNYYLWLNHATGKVFVDKKYLDWTNHNNVKNTFKEQEIAKISDGAFVNNEAFELVPVEDGE